MNLNIAISYKHSEICWLMSLSKVLKLGPFHPTGNAMPQSGFSEDCFFPINPLFIG